MKRTTATWTIADLKHEFLAINFPEYQRESNIWSRAAKQLLIDSILREFDIAALYFYRNQDDSLDCIDGRQRLSAIMSFLGQNPDDSQDNGFPLRLSNEIVREEENRFARLDGLTLAHISQQDDPLARALAQQLDDYRLNLVLLSEAGESEEFNLQFTRLNLGTILNAGEKLHAMVGELRDLCFDSLRVGRHPFLDRVGVPSRRYAREQIAAQAVAHALEFRRSENFARTRHVDLQRLLKEHAKLGEAERGCVDSIATTLDYLDTALPDATCALLRSRALVVSVVLFAWLKSLSSKEELQRTFPAFLSTLISRIRWQVQEYRALRAFHAYGALLEFQRHLTQASVERPAVEKRHQILEEEFKHWLETGTIRGDVEYRDEVGQEPGD